MLAGVWVYLMNTFGFERYLIIVLIIELVKTGLSYILIWVFVPFICGVMRLVIFVMILKANVMIVILHLVLILIDFWRLFTLFSIIDKNWTLVFEMLQIVNFQICCSLFIISVMWIINALILRRIRICPSSIGPIVTSGTVIWSLNKLTKTMVAPDNLWLLLSNWPHFLLFGHYQRV